MLEQTKEFDQIKIIDFGTSLVFDENKKLTGVLIYLYDEFVEESHVC